MQRVLILGAAGRDFHNFNVVFRNNPEFHVVAFTATQIPDIAGRRYPAQLAGDFYPDGIPILEENKMEEIIHDELVDVVVFSYSDVAYPTLMHLASRAVAAGADFWLLGVERTQLVAKVPVISICAVRTGCGKSPVSRRIATELRQLGWNPVVVRHPMPYGDLAVQHAQRFGSLADLDKHLCTIEEREEYEPHIIEGTHGLCRSGLRGNPAPGGEGGRCCLVGRRQQRHVVLSSRSRHRCARSASRRDTSSPTTPAK